MTMSAFNEDQQDYMRELAALAPSEKCACGWYRRGACPNCKPEFGGFVRCGSVNAAASDEPCHAKLGHDDDHLGFRRQGAGGYSTHWPREIR